MVGVGASLTLLHHWDPFSSTTLPHLALILDFVPIHIISYYAMVSSYPLEACSCLKANGGAVDFGERKGRRDMLYKRKNIGNKKKITHGQNKQVKMSVFIFQVCKI